MTSASPAASSTTKAPDPFADRAAPYSAEAEQAVLGAMFLDADAALRAAETLEDWMFYREAHRRLFRVMIGIARRGGVIDPITLKDELERKSELEAVGGVDYLSYLLDVVPTAANFDYHARIVHDKALLRRLAEVGTQIVQEAFEGHRLAAEVLDSAERKIFQIAEPATLRIERVQKFAEAEVALAADDEVPVVGSGRAFDGVVG